MKVITSSNNLYVHKLEWVGEELRASFYYEVTDATGEESSFEPYLHLQDIRIDLRSRTFEIFAAFRDRTPVNIAYRVEPTEEVVYVEAADL